MSDEIKTLTAERDALAAENARLREQLADVANANTWQECPGGSSVMSAAYAMESRDALDSQREQWTKADILAALRSFKEYHKANARRRAM